MKENETVKYKEPENKVCNICGEKSDYLEFYQVKQATCPTGEYFKYVGYVCEKCIKEKIGLIFKNFKRVWDTPDFEMAEYKEHLLMKP